MRALLLCFLLVLCSCDDEDQTYDCDDPCSEGETFCTVYGEAVLCEGPDENGCFRWGRPEVCGQRQSCIDGACTCAEFCEPEEQSCGPNRGMLPCEGPDEDGCYFWGDEQPCAPELCEELCGCEESCETGSALCGPDGGVVTCEGADERNCSIWSEEVPCLASQECIYGNCRCTESECYAWARRCAAPTSSQACAGPNEEGCFAWVEPLECGADQHCSDLSGLCAPDGPVECADVNECEEEGRRYCGDVEYYRECIRDERGCLVLDGDV